MSAQRSLTKFFPYSPSPSTQSESSNATPSRKTRKRPRSAANGLTQTVIDAGQAKVGLEFCEECGMAYNVDHEGDVKIHKEYHSRLVSTKSLHLKTNQIDHWKREVKFVKFDTPVEGILFVVPADSKCISIKKKVDEIVQIYVNEEVGFCDDVETWKENRTAFLFVTKLPETKKPIQFIAGITLVDPVKSVLLQPEGTLINSGNFVGINRIWVHPTMRRKRLATLFANVSRRLIYPDVAMEKTKVAFNEPSGDGLNFVLAYFGHQNGRYLTYDDN